MNTSCFMKRILFSFCLLILSSVLCFSQENSNNISNKYFELSPEFKELEKKSEENKKSLDAIEYQFKENRILLEAKINELTSTINILDNNIKNYKELFSIFLVLVFGLIGIPSILSFISGRKNIKNMRKDFNEIKLRLIKETLKQKDFVFKQIRSLYETIEPDGAVKLGQYIRLLSEEKKDVHAALKSVEKRPKIFNNSKTTSMLCDLKTKLNWKLEQKLIEHKEYTSLIVKIENIIYMFSQKNEN